MSVFFRYFSVSQNELASLPYQLTQCRLEELDISSNEFLHRTIPNIVNTPTLKNCSMENLVNIASKVVLKYKLFYDRKTIPWTLVEFLDNANVCICGMPVLNTDLIKIPFELKDYFNMIISNVSTTVYFECYFCSPFCHRKLYFHIIL